MRLAGQQGLNLLEADRLEMDRIARSSNHQGVVLKVQPFEYSSLHDLVEAADRKAKAMEAVNSAATRMAATPAVHRARRRDRSAEPRRRDPFGRRVSARTA